MILAQLDDSDECEGVCVCLWLVSIYVMENMNCYDYELFIVVSVASHMMETVQVSLLCTYVRTLYNSSILFLWPWGIQFTIDKFDAMER